MDEKLWESLNTCADAIRTFGRWEDANAIRSLAEWLRLNGVRSISELDNFLASTHDNPNIRPYFAPQV